MRRIQKAFVILVLCSFLVSIPLNVFSSWGTEVGRANKEDEPQRILDWVAMKKGRVDMDKAIIRDRLADRQKVALGLDPLAVKSEAELLEGVHDWWMNQVMGPSQRIALNPAASCEEAAMAVTNLRGMSRARAILGIEETAERAAEMARILEATDVMMLNRCREEALDECVATGRFRQIILLVAFEQKSQALLPRQMANPDWAEDALEQCAIYDLKFISKTKVATVAQLGVEIVRDGMITIKYDRSAGSIEEASNAAKLRDFFHGETEGPANPSFSIKCPQLPVGQVTCLPTFNPPVRARLELMDLRHREYRFRDGVPSVIPEQGADEFKLELSDGIFKFVAVIKVPYGNDQEILFDKFGASFYIAHKKDQTGEGAAQGKGTAVKIDRKTRGAYPVIFQFTYADQNQVGEAEASDSTEFKLVHRPEPKPFPARPTDPTLKPVKSKPGGGN